MFIPYKSRELLIGQLVAVHFNSHKDTYSIVEMKSPNTIGNVLGYADNLTLADCRFKIDNYKQKSVIDTAVKDRHAYVIGYVEDFIFNDMPNELYYSPKYLKSFINKAEQFSERPVYLERVNKVSFTVANDKPLVKFKD